MSELFDITSRGTIEMAAFISFLVGIAMKFTPARFDKQRFAQPFALGFALIISLGESFMASHIPVWSAIVRGVVLAMAATGAHSVIKTARHINNNNEHI